MDTNPKVPPAQPVNEPIQFPSKSESTPVQEPQPLATLSAPAYIAEPADYRLVIDKDPISGAFVYRTVDRFSGETVSQFPNEELVRLRDSADYISGTIVDKKV